jgi:hypothetical protein
MWYGCERDPTPVAVGRIGSTPGGRVRNPFLQNFFHRQPYTVQGSALNDLYDLLGSTRSRCMGNRGWILYHVSCIFSVT